MFKNVMVALGLGPDEEYDDRYLDDDMIDEFGDEELPAGPVRSRPVATQATDSGMSNSERLSTGTVSAVRPIRSVGADEDNGVTIRPLNRDSDEISAVTPVASSKPRSVSPQSFGDAKIIADEFKRGTPVIMQLTDLERDLARRLIDFASGVCYSLGGSMEKMAPHVFLLLPKGTEVSADERRRIEERGFDRV